LRRVIVLDRASKGVDLDSSGVSIESHKEERA
jgi:hypothetical protein